MSDRLKSVLNVKGLVEIWNDFEERLSVYFDKNIREANYQAGKQLCHPVLEKLYYGFSINHLYYFIKEYSNPSFITFLSYPNKSNKVFQGLDDKVVYQLDS